MSGREALFATTLIVHLLASAVLHPRAKAYFSDEARLEEFIATLARGARWAVLGGLAVIGFTGVMLVVLRATPVSIGWVALMGAKSALFVVATGVFCYASWWLWPRRIFATPDEFPAMQRAFRRVATALLSMASAAIACGALARYF